MGHQVFACSAAFSSTPVRARGTASSAPVTQLRQNSRPSTAGQLARLDHPAVRQVTFEPGGDVAARPRPRSRRRARCRCRRWRRAGSARRCEIDLLAAAGQRAHDRRAAADVGAVADDHARPTIRPSTIEVPSVPALKLTKPSCITVVPAARWAPSRTRSASAIRTPDGHHVVGHPRELVDAVHGQTAAGGALAQPQLVDPLRRARARPRSRPRWAAGRRCRRGWLVRPDQPVREQVQPQVRVGGVARRVGQRGRSIGAHDVACARRAAGPSAPSAAPAASARLGVGRAASPRPSAREPGVEHRPSAVTVARPMPQAAASSRHASTVPTLLGLRASDTMPAHDRRWILAGPGRAHPRAGRHRVGVRRREGDRRRASRQALRDAPHLQVRADRQHGHGPHGPRPRRSGWCSPGTSTPCRSPTTSRPRWTATLHVRLRHLGHEVRRRASRCTSRSTLPEPRYDVTYLFYDCEEVEAEPQRPRPVAASHPDCCAADFAVLLEPTVRRGRGRLPGHACGSRSRTTGPAGALRPGPGSASTRSTPPARCCDRLAGVRAARRSTSTAASTARGSTRSASPAAWPATSIPDECAVDGQLPVRAGPDRGRGRGAPARGLRRATTSRCVDSRAGRAARAGRRAGRRSSSPRSAADAGGQVRLDRRGPVRGARHPGA